MGIDFDFGLIYYAYPDAFDPGAELDYWEFKAGVSGKVADPVKLRFTFYYSPDYTGETGDNYVYEGSVEVSLPKLQFLDPSVSATFGYNDNDGTFIDYGYFNVGLRLGFAEKFSLDLRFWDTFNTPSGTCTNVSVFQCDERFVASLAASF